MKLTLTNSLSNNKEIFAASSPNKTTLYVCGITPYDFAHIGHGRCYVVFDLLVRLFRFLGQKVTYVRNYTDIDDKIIAKAEQAGDCSPTGCNRIAKKFITHYQEDMQKLNCITPNIEPKVTEHIDEIVTFIEELIKQQKAYIIDHDVYFDISAYPEYGKLSKKKIDQLEAGSRVNIDTRKKNPGDFALWKGNNKELFWPSPWGHGRPGWHIECSVMAKKYLGDSIDIHGGGADLIFPHHENEIAQSESLHNKPFAHMWLHNAFVNINKEKMSKSLGNFITLNDIFERYEPAVLRYFFLQHHYRTPIDFSYNELDSVGVAYHKLVQHFSQANTSEVTQNYKQLTKQDPLIKELLDALLDDLNSPKMLGLIFQNFSLIKQSPQLSGVIKVILQEVLGLSLQSNTQKPAVPITPEIQELINKREKARKAKDWATADTIRDSLQRLGIDIQDKKQS